MKLLPNKFPSISRLFTERKLLKRLQKNWFRLSDKYKLEKIYAYISILLTLLVSTVLIFLIIVISVSFSQNYLKYSDLSSKRSEIISKINFWKSISQKYDGYPQAYFNIAVLYWQLNDMASSRKYLDETLILNPSYEEAEILDKELEKRGF